MIGTTLGATDELPIGTYDGLDIGYLEGSIDVITDRNLEGLLLEV